MLAYYQLSKHVFLDVPLINPRKSRSKTADGTYKQDYESTHLFHLISMSPPQFGGGIVLNPSIDRQVKTYFY